MSTRKWSFATPPDMRPLHPVVTHLPGSPRQTIAAEKGATARRGLLRLLIPAAAIIGLLAVPGATHRAAAAPPNALCVGGPHCYATVQAALAAAHDGDTIRVGRGTFAGGVTIDKSVNLFGVAAAATTISGGGPVVTIGSGTSTPTVTLANVTITGGLTTGNPQAPHCGPDVPTCGPGYADATALGGGIEAFPGTTVTIIRSVITGNRSAPRLSTDSVKATCPGPAPCPVSFGDAAGIDNWGTMTLIGTTVSANHASAVQSNGGGIANEANASLTLRNSRVTGNSAAAVAPFGRFVSGGGIFVDSGGTLTVDNSKIDGNAANLTSSIPHPFPMQDGGSDAANSLGGGIQLADDATATIRDSALSGNRVNVTNSVGEPYGADAAICACDAATLTLENARVDGNSVNVNVLNTADSGPSGPSALEADSNATIQNTQFKRNSTNVTAIDGDAGALGALAFFFGGTVTPTITNGTISDNASNAASPKGATTIQGVGITNNGPLVLTHVEVKRNRGTATGLSGFAQGGGIWNGHLFGGPDSPLTLVKSRVTRNVLSGSSKVTLQGGGIFTPGFPLTLTNSSLTHNTPDDCFGC